jgi:hypothetical protein
MPAQDRAGVTRRCLRSIDSSLRTSAAKTARIRPVQAGLGVDSAQHGDFVTQHEKFDVFRRRRAAQQRQQIQNVEEDQVEQTQRHSARSCSEKLNMQITRSSGVGRLLEPHR